VQRYPTYSMSRPQHALYDIELGISQAPFIVDSQLFVTTSLTDISNAKPILSNAAWAATFFKGTTP
jgi:hypothetical protein